MCSSDLRVAGPYTLMLVSAAVLLVCAVTTRAAHRKAMAAPMDPLSPGGEADRPLSRDGVWRLLAGDRYLWLIACLTILLNIVNTSGEFLLGKFVGSEALRLVGADVSAQQRFIGEFYGHFFAWVNGVGLILQTFAVSRIFRYAGVRGALFILPCIALASASCLLFLPVLPVVRWGKILENSTDYSVQSTTRQALFLLTTREVKYKVKAAIDTFFVRTGDVLAAGVVYVGSTIGQIGRAHV